MVTQKDLRQQFGAKVRLLRLKKGLTQEQLASRAGMHFTYVGQIERGRRNPSLVNIEKLAKALGVPSSTILPF